MGKNIIQLSIVFIFVLVITGCATRNVVPIIDASDKGNLHLVKNQIHKGVYIDQRGENNYTPLLKASSSGKLNVVKYLVEQGADLQKTTKWGSSPLELSSTNGHLDVVKYLLTNKNVDIDQQNIYKNTALHIATYKEKLPVVKYLVEKGAKTDIKNTSGLTALGIAIRDKRTQMERYLKSVDNIDYVSPKKVIEDTTSRVKHQTNIETYIAKKDFQGLKKYLDENPSTVKYIKDDNMRLLLTGPSGMKIGDIKKHIDKKRSEKIIISLIKRVRSPYKEFTLDEIDKLSAMGISDNIISTMMDVTTELVKEEDNRNHLKSLQSKEKTKIIYKERNVSQNNSSDNQNNPVVDKVQDELIKQGAKMLFDKLF